MLVYFVDSLLDVVDVVVEFDSWMEWLYCEVYGVL